MILFTAQHYLFINKFTFAIFGVNEIVRYNKAKGINEFVIDLNLK